MREELNDSFWSEDDDDHVNENRVSVLWFDPHKSTVVLCKLILTLSIFKNNPDQLQGASTSMKSRILDVLMELSVQQRDILAQLLQMKKELNGQLQKMYENQKGFQEQLLKMHEQQEDRYKEQISFNQRWLDVARNQPSPI